MYIKGSFRLKPNIDKIAYGKNVKTYWNCSKELQRTWDKGKYTNVEVWTLDYNVYQANLNQNLNIDNAMLV